MIARRVGVSMLVALALFLAEPISSIASYVIIPTGGNFLMDGSTTAVIDPSYGVFDAAQYEPLFDGIDEYGNTITSERRTVSIAGSYSPAEIALSVRGFTWYAPSGDLSVLGSAAGSIGFDLTEPQVVRFSWSQTSAVHWNLDPEASLILRGHQDSIALGCTGGYGWSGLPGGCLEGADADPFAHGLTQKGQLSLAAGHYDLMVQLSSSQEVGNPVNTDFLFGLSAVPIPATLPLLLSGLAFSGAILVRRKHASRENHSQAHNC